MSIQLDLIIQIENELLGLMIDGHLPSQVEKQVEQACASIIRARNLLQLSLEASTIDANEEMASQILS